MVLSVLQQDARPVGGPAGPCAGIDTDKSGAPFLVRSDEGALAAGHRRLPFPGIAADVPPVNALLFLYLAYGHIALVVPQELDIAGQGRHLDVPLVEVMKGERVVLVFFQNRLELLLPVVNLIAGRAALWAEYRDGNPNKDGNRR